MKSEELTASAPGRICLFGEHQDYLGLPVIAAAINLRISITGEPRNDRVINIDLPDIAAQEKIDLDQRIVYSKEKDYFKSGVNVLLRNNIRFSHGYNCRVRSDIPINSGTSSSSALSVAWIKFLLEQTCDKRRNEPLEIARFAYHSEVVEFNEHGGMMDQYTSSFGKLLYIDFQNPHGPERLPGKLGRFVLGDSCEPKDTQSILRRVKDGALKAFKTVKARNNAVTMKTITHENLEVYKPLLSSERYKLLEANIIDRDLTQRAKTILERETVDHGQFGSLLNAHQYELRERLHVSTPKIDRMIDAALENGALGAKINGSGGGGCMFTYAPEAYEQVYEAIARIGGKPYIISIDEGVKVE